MATILAVHGTFAHAGGEAGAEGADVGTKQWWQPDSEFRNEMRQLLDAPGGRLEVVHFEWSGENSELDRRQAGKALLQKILELESRNEPYCLVGHSHGGSVIAAALLRAAAKKQKLPHLRRWITVGTPFVNMRREPFLFTRLDLPRKVIFVASMMLLLMFSVYIAAEMTSGKSMVLGGRYPGILIATGLMMSLPALVFYLLLRYFDGRGLLLYRRRVTARAGEYFSDRWLSLAHRDDEAIQGLAFLPEAKLTFFDKSFAVPTITVLSVVALPLLYLFLITSPKTMVSIANWLKTDVYESRVSPGAAAAVREISQERRLRRQEFGPRSRQPGALRDDTQANSGAEQRFDPAAREERRKAWQEYRSKRRELEERYSDLNAAERAFRFKQRFFERKDMVCENGVLCGNGENLRVNSALVLHVATDELSWMLGGEELGAGRTRWIWSALIPGILVPLISGLIALALMLVIRSFAGIVSSLSSTLLNSLTNAEVRRSAFGNDTEGEIAVGAVDRPSWIERSPPRLPGAIDELITDYSNGMASQSLAKFRRMIGGLASAEPKHTADTAVTTYFTWKELVHASYFDVPEFRKLVAEAVSRVEGFAPSADFKKDPDHTKTAQWLAEIEGAPRSLAEPGSEPPNTSDVAAVAAVVASTVKAEP
ncbi:MAG: alpha/beta fold hydrolase [Hyphomicrobiaceae bacterium]|nr:alpha/beta fold hydrolase [Hyphomicrobiaceae bacterium]